MAYKGQIWNNPATGDRIEVLETGKENGGQRLSYRFRLKPGSIKLARHFHEKQDEIFEIISGKLTYILNNELKVAGAGQRVILHKGIPHTHYNAEKDNDLEMIQTIVPALDSEWLVDSVFGLAQDEKFKNGEPRFLQVMVWLRYYKAKTYLAKVPRGVQNFLSFLLAPVARMLGYKAAYKRYSGVDA